MSYNFKSEEDVKLFLQNLYTEYSFGCLSEKDPEVCHLFGEYHESIKREYKKSTEIFKKNCDTFDFARSCTSFARHNILGLGCKKDFKTAFQYMKKGCELGDGSGCLYAGLMTVSKDDIGVVDRKAAMEEGLSMLNRSCFDLKEPKACIMLGSIYYSGNIPGVEKNLPSAYKLFCKSCETGSAPACSTVAQMLTNGEGVEKNLDLAQDFRERAKELENEMKQGVQFQQGITL